MRAAAPVALLALASCNLFGTTFPDVCGGHKGQTCIALGLGCDDDVQVDQLELQSTTPGLLPGGDVRSPNPARSLSLPAVVAVLPDPTFTGGDFTINVSAYFRGNKVLSGLQVKGTVAVGATLKLNADSHDELCLNSAFSSPCNNCPGCCVDNACVQQFLGCDGTHVCALSQSAGGGLQCQACGELGQLCCAGAKCSDGCCSSGNPGGTCLPVGSVCSTTGVVLYCLPQPGAAPGCRRCGDRDDPCCPGADGGAPTCLGNGCCDPSSNICVTEGAACKGTNVSCQPIGCAPCGASGQECCPPPPGLGGGPHCISGNCDAQSMCP